MFSVTGFIQIQLGSGRSLNNLSLWDKDAVMGLAPSPTGPFAALICRGSGLEAASLPAASGRDGASVARLEGVSDTYAKPWSKVRGMS